MTDIRNELNDDVDAAAIAAEEAKLLKEARYTLAGYRATVSRLSGKTDPLSLKTIEAAETAIAKLVRVFPDLSIASKPKRSTANLSDDKRAKLSLAGIRAAISRKRGLGASDDELAEFFDREREILEKFPHLKEAAKPSAEQKLDMLLMRAEMRSAAVAKRADIDAALAAALGTAPQPELTTSDEPDTVPTVDGEVLPPDTADTDTDTARVEPIAKARGRKKAA